MNYQEKNQQLLTDCLRSLEWLQDEQIKHALNCAFRKAIKLHSLRPVPPLYCRLVAEDLGCDNTQWAGQLNLACAYFYTAADLLDDIQDHDPEQPVLQLLSPEQAMNIVNLLIMGAYQAISNAELPQERKSALFQLFINMGTIMSLGQFWDIDSTNSRNAMNPEQIVRAKAGAEFGCFFACIPCASGRLDTALFYQLGEEMGALLQVFTDYFDIWLVPDQNSLSQDLLVLKNSFPLYWARQDSNLGQTIDMALSGQNRWPSKQYKLRRLLVHSQTIAAFDGFLKKTKNKFKSSLADLPELPQISKMLVFDQKQAQELSAGLKKLREITQTHTWSAQLHKRLKTSKKMALDYLQFIPDFKDVWEVQRWGFLETETLYGNVFNPLLVLESLAACGENVADAVEQILKKHSKYGWHYYSNTQKIPTDTDDLGQVLQLSTHLPHRQIEELFKRPLELLEKNIEVSGFCPTWLCDEEFYQREQVNQNWFGNECHAVMANLYYGLSVYDSKNYAELIAKGVEYLISNYDPQKPGWLSPHYASDLYVNYLVVRLLKQQHAAFDFTPLIKFLLAQQLLDGSWAQSAQETAFASLILCCVSEREDLQLPLKYASNFLIDSQNFDGSWSGEDLFIRPGKEAVYENFSHPKLTAAFCLRALQDVERWFELLL